MDISEVLNLEENQYICSNSIINEIHKSKEIKILLPTGAKNFDKILNGGFCSGKTYLIFGANKTGKTQLSHQLCIQAYINFSEKIKKNKNPSMKSTYYLDTENTFRPERLIELSTAHNLDSSKVLKSLMVSKIMGNSALFLQLNELEENLKVFKKTNNNCLLIIDSINNHYRFDQGDKNLSFNNTKTLFLKILQKIDELTKKFDLITIATAQVASNFIEKSVIRELPVGNIFLNHFFSEYLYLSYKEENKIYAHLVNSEILPEKKILYKITPKGIEDYKI